jgi:chemotaxis protein MotA
VKGLQKSTGATARKGPTSHGFSVFTRKVFEKGADNRVSGSCYERDFADSARRRGLQYPKGEVRYIRPVLTLFSQHRWLSDNYAHAKGDHVFVIIGMVVVLAGVLGGFALEGGPFLVLMQVAEFMIIGGSAIGSLLVSAPASVLKKLVQKLIGTLKGSAVSQEMYLELLKLLFEVFQMSRKEGLIALEGHIERPEESAIFQKYPQFQSNHHLISFMCDTFRLIILGGVPAHDMEALMDTDIDGHHAEGALPATILQKTGDALPGLGIVAAVLGIIITMQAISGPPEEIGEKVAAALVGTFLGILLSYGFLQPLATNLELANEDESKLYETIKSSIIAFAKGFNPIVCVEFGRRTIPSDFRPSFQMMEDHVKGKK